MVELPEALSDKISARYNAEDLIAAEKMLGFVVTPTTFDSAMSDARLPFRRRSRERSSSHMETPASLRAFRLENITLPPLQWILWPQ